MALKMAAIPKSDSSNKQRPRYLADPERVRKDLEHERRITRLQQVRRSYNFKVCLVIKLRNPITMSGT